MFAHLHLNKPRERLLVGLADLALSAAAPLAFRAAGSGGTTRPAILLLRLERVGDLLMILDAIAAVRVLAPDARIDLVTASWNEPIARLMPSVDRLETLDVPWLARGAAGDSASRLLKRAWSWRRHRYDLAINFEGDIRSNVLLGVSGARRRVGFDMAGGGAALTDRVPFDATRHTLHNALRLVERAFDLPPDAVAARSAVAPRLVIPPAVRERARILFADLPRPLVAMHLSGGREIKQWDLERFADVARRLAASHGATLVFTGIEADRPLVDAVRSRLGSSVNSVDLAGQIDLVALAAALLEMDLLITGDTGPMHLAAALDVPTVAIFGPSDPARWGPLSSSATVVRASLPCSPCNQIRVPPAHCRGHVPDCLRAVDAGQVYDAAVSALRGAAPGAGRETR